MGGLDTTYLTTKLTFAANNDSVDGYIRHVYKEITDTVPVRWYITKDEQAACATKTLGSGMAVEKYLEGAFNCTSAIPTGGYSRNHNAGIGLTGTDKMWAETYSALDPGSNVKRQRVQGQVNFNSDNHQSGWHFTGAIMLLIAVIGISYLITGLIEISKKLPFISFATPNAKIFFWVSLFIYAVWLIPALISS